MNQANCVLSVALSYPPRVTVRVRTTVSVKAAFLHDVSSITTGGTYESAISAANCPSEHREPYHLSLNHNVL